MEPVSRAVHCGVDRRYRECRFTVLKASRRDTANRQYRYSRGVCHRLFHLFQEIVSKARQHPTEASPSCLTPTLGIRFRLTVIRMGAADAGRFSGRDSPVDMVLTRGIRHGSHATGLLNEANDPISGALAPEGSGPSVVGGSALWTLSYLSVAIANSPPTIISNSRLGPSCLRRDTNLRWLYASYTEESDVTSARSVSSPLRPSGAAMAHSSSSRLRSPRRVCVILFRG